MRSLALIASLIAATPALAQEKGPAPNSAEPAASEKKICRNMAPIGSRLTKRECHTKAEWASIDARNGQAAGNFRDQAQRQNGQF